MNKCLSRIFIPVFTFILIFSSNSILISERKKHSYVGAGACAKCHASDSIGNQYEKWLRTPHAKAVLVLKAESGLAIGKKLSISDPSEELRCLKCHTSGGGRAQDSKGEGVGCEACHGPGSDYHEAINHVDTINRVSAYEKAQKNGMYPTLGIKNIKKREKLCLHCHDNNRPCYPTDPKEVYRQSISLQVITDLRKGSNYFNHHLIPPFPQY
jgi:hypothetical protein